VANAQRSALLPGVPTFAEAGVAGYEAYSWAGFVAPAGTPREVVARLNAEIGKLMVMPDVRKTLLGAGVEPAPAGPEAATAYITEELARWGKVVKDTGIQME
jgi:tripartite-type tricarboxylate transporter receptor subunit TctC